jgi:hypothetical protein
VNANDAAYRHKNVDPDFSDRLNGARKPKATKAERTARNAERAAAAVTKQELVMSQADALTQWGFGGLGNFLRASTGVIDWKACVAAVTNEDVTIWATWRGRSEDAIRQFVQRGCYGKYDGSFALPIRDNESGKVIGVHYRPALKDKAWRVHPVGTPQTPIIHGNPAEADLVIIAESPFDMDRLIDELQLWNNTKPWATVCTKGAGNALSVPDVFQPETKILVLLQRDEPAKKWLSDLSAHLMRPLYVLQVPPDVDPKINDIDDWFRYGGADQSQLSELIGIALTYPQKPILILPSAGVPIISCAKILFKGLAKQKTYFVRNDELVTPRESCDGLYLHPLLKTEFASELERPFELKKYVESKEGPELKPSRCGVENAQILLHTREMREYSLPLRSVAASPVLIERNGKPVVLQKGYHPDEEGFFVAKNLDIPKIITLSEAVELLRWGLFANYKWVSPSDLSRAVAQVISPALKLGNLLPGADFPIDLGLADQSQGGKTHRMKFTTRIYGEHAYTVINKRGGVGSLDETVASALCSGKLFITIDNVRGDIDSQLLESTLRGTGSAPVRLPYRSEILVRTDRVIVQLTSNSANLTKDLANRCIITNSRKQSGDYRPQLPWGQDFIRLVEENQAMYLGAVHAVVKEWILLGKPRTNETRHDFRDWVQSLDWIVQNIFQLPPLMNDHPEAQSRLSDKTFSWFREAVLGLVRANKLGVPLQATDIRDVCDTNSIVIPGLRGDANDEARNQFLGRLLAQVFKDSETVFVEEYSATRFLEKGLHKDAKKYTINKTDPPQSR